ncbi:MAG: phospholipid carrier-dependent glycosyltransferase [Rhodospirillaceae bacterium]|nr:phospholipid carrier-dependent glycosyltransferase [Rhodospirillaceae bacterium]
MIHTISRMLPRSPVVHVALVCFVYAIVVAAAISEKQPWFDEGGYANPAYNLLNYGHLGMPILYSQLEVWPGMDYYTYHMPPLSFVLQAGWFALFDFGVIQMRTLSALFGVLLIISLYLFLRRISENHWLALLAALIVATDYNITLWAADGRMDIMSAAWGFAAVAVFVNLREKHFGWAILLSQALVVASGLTHPAGILYFLAIAALILFYDRSRLRLRHIALGGLPFVVGLLAWGQYILQDFEAFQTHFLGNYGGREDRIIALPLAELSRYLSPAFGIGEHVEGVARLKILQLIAYWGAALTILLMPRIRAESKTGPLLILLVLFILGTAIILSGTHLSYLVHIIPLYASLLAAVLWSAIRHSSMLRLAAVGLAILLVAIQAGGPIAKYFGQNAYQTVYMPAVERIAELRQPGDVIIASSEFGFAFGFEGEVVDNYYLGVGGGQTGDIVVIDGGYRKVYGGMSQYDPERLEIVMQLLKTKYALVDTFGGYEIFTLIDRAEGRQ